jgi:uncharacterized membrane protein (UPF0127 family)
MRVFTTILVLAFLALAGSRADAQLEKFASSSLTITTAKGDQPFTVELALTPAQQQLGLMYRRELAPDAGMLFVFPQPQPTAFWMKNTLIPLDMLFIAADGRIADIHERAVPLSEANIPARVPVKAVLELNGGTVARLGIKPGDIVHHATFGTAG